MPDPAIAMSSESEEQGFADALAVFAKDDVAVPEPVLPPPQVPPPTPEPEKELEAQPVVEEKQADLADKEPEKTPPQEFEEEYVEFQGKQKERFNSVYGTMRRFERENLTLQQQLQRMQQQLQTQPPPVQQQPPAYQPSQPTSFLEPEPKLEQFETADQWGARLSDWTARKVKAEVLAEIQNYNLTKQQEETRQRSLDYINSRIVEGQKQFGTREFNQASKEVIEFAPAGSSMYNLLINSEQFPSVVTHLAKNLPEADRISSLRYEDQVFELKSLERKIALAAKSKSNNNKQATKVEAPGAGEEPGNPSVSINKLRSAAKASGNLKDWAKVFQADPTM